MKAASFLSTLPCVPPPIILGSGSATRKAILTELGLSFTVVKPDIDEKAIRRPKPADLVLALGRAKAEALLEREELGDAWLLTCDQVVVWEGQILEKPADEAECRAFIDGYGRAPCGTVGSVVVTDVKTRQQWHAVDTTKVTFDPIPQASVDALIAEGECFYCAGGLIVEHPLVAPHIKSLEGGQDAVMGLSKATVESLLREAALDRTNPNYSNSKC